MGICMFGIDHNRASIDIRSVFSFTRKNAVTAMEELKKTEGQDEFCDQIMKEQKKILKR